jgi:hypothetical protein
MYKGWAIKVALAPRPLTIYCASPLAAAMIITVAALRIVLAHGSTPTWLVSSLLHSPQYKRHTCYSSTAWSWTVDFLVGKWRPVRRADKLIAICGPIV